MTLYFRLLILLFKIYFSPKRHPLDISITNFRVLPTDCDLNFHLTSSRYPAFMEAASFHHAGQMGILSKLLKRRCFPINVNYDVTYIRPIKPFEKFSVVSRTVTWNDKYLYKEHRFEVDGELRAFGMVRAVFVCKKVVISMGEIKALMGEQVITPDVPEAVLKWESFLKAKKEQSLQNRE